MDTDYSKSKSASPRKTVDESNKIIKKFTQINTKQTWLNTLMPSNNNEEKPRNRPTSRAVSKSKVIEEDKEEEKYSDFNDEPLSILASSISSSPKNKKKSVLKS